MNERNETRQRVESQRTRRSLDGEAEQRSLIKLSRQREANEAKRRMVGEARRRGSTGVGISAIGGQRRRSLHLRTAEDVFVVPHPRELALVFHLWTGSIGSSLKRSENLFS